MDVKLTGAASQKRVVVQPAAVVETGAISGGGAGAGDYVFGSIVLVR
jgi:hypothetical protein